MVLSELLTCSWSLFMRVTKSSAFIGYKSKSKYRLKLNEFIVLVITEVFLSGTVYLNTMVLQKPVHCTLACFISDQEYEMEPNRPSNMNPWEVRMRECESRVHLPIMEKAQNMEGIIHAKENPHIWTITLINIDPIITGRIIRIYLSVSPFKITFSFFKISSTNESICMELI